ncbi:hypothetical protein [Clostridium sp.]|uniref:hypothetical protein n=1 Tax=Clostridium sp. TaxID=1506 RepID=UPI00262C2550|nr:hypothetical protein [Clostridium sp.]
MNHSYSINNLRDDDMEKYFHFDGNKSLQKLEGLDLGGTNFDSHLVLIFHELKKEAIGIVGDKDIFNFQGYKFILQSKYKIQCFLSIIAIYFCNGSKVWNSSMLFE